jgi:nucleolar protein 16
MGRELQKKKKRSSIPKVRMKPKSKRVNPLGNPIIAANWYGNTLPPPPQRILSLPPLLHQTCVLILDLSRNQKETLTQNYKRLGLTSRLNSATGGTEKLSKGDASKTNTTSKLAISNAIPMTIEPTEARVERDPETGKILRVIHTDKKSNPLNDPLNEIEDEEMDEGDDFEGFDRERGENPIVKMLEEQARSGKETKPRTQSEREREWIERLVGRYGEDYGKMVWDRKLNPFQQTEGDIRRRVAKWKAKGGVVPAAAA